MIILRQNNYSKADLNRLGQKTDKDIREAVKGTKAEKKVDKILDKSTKEMKEAAQKEYSILNSITERRLEKRYLSGWPDEYYGRQSMYKDRDYEKVSREKKIENIKKDIEFLEHANKTNKNTMKSEREGYDYDRAASKHWRNNKELQEKRKLLKQLES